jgi:hypothetical protein
MSEERFERTEQPLDRLETRQLDLNAQFARLEGRLDDLDRHMHVLHEDVIARIAAIPKYTGPTKAEMKRGFADLRKAINRWLNPVDAFERHRRTRRLRH